MYVIVNPYSFHALGINEEIIKNKEFLIIASSIVRNSYPSELNKKILFVEEWNDRSILSCCHDIAKEFRVHAFISTSEEAIPIVGMLNNTYCSSFNIAQKLSQSLNFTDKYFMRLKLDNIVSQPEFFCVDSIKNIKDILIKKPGDYILKPRSQSSAKGLFTVSSSDDLSALDKEFNGYIMEEFVDYDIMLTSDGVANGGDICKVFIHQYGEKLTDSIKNSEFATIQTSSLYQSNPNVIDRIVEESKKVLQYLSSVGNIVPFHFEWFYNSREDKITFCEGASRFGGAMIPELINLAFSFDIKKYYWDKVFNQVNEESFNLYSYPEKLACSYLPYRKKGEIMSLPNTKLFDWVSYLRFFVKEGEVTDSSKNAVENILICLFTASDENDIERRIENLNNIIKKNLQYK